MTPKEKAIELYEKFSGFIPQKSWASKNYSAMECALIAVDEILNEYNDFMQTREQFGYWEEVKQEIEKL
jgi:hypothetical protein